MNAIEKALRVKTVPAVEITRFVQLNGETDLDDVARNFCIHPKLASQRLSRVCRDGFIIMVRRKRSKSGKAVNVYKIKES